MPLLQGPLTSTRFAVIGDYAASSRDDLLERIQNNRFTEPLTSTRRDDITGWVSIHNMLETDLPGSEVVLDHLLFFALRVQRKRLPAKLVKAMLEQRGKAWMRETGQERIPPNVRRELRELLEAELLPQVLPSVNSYGICWDVARSEVVIDTQSGTALEHFRVLFQRSFGALLRPINPVALVLRGLASDEILEGLRSVGYSNLSDPKGEQA